MREVLFEIGPFTVYGYGLMVAVGVMAAFLAGMYREKKYAVGDDRLFPLGMWCLVCGFASAKAMFVITELPTLFSNPGYFLRTLASGFVVYGGLIGGILTGYAYCRVKKLPFLKYFDLVMPSIALAQAFGRLGCLMAGCCYGKETAGAFHIIFPDTCGYAPGGVWLIPTQPISAGANFLHFFVLTALAKRTKSDGQVGGLYLIFYSVGRFAIEFFRGDPRGNVGPLSTSQFIAIFMLIAGIAVYAYCGKKYPKIEGGDGETAESGNEGEEASEDGDGEIAESGSEGEEASEDGDGEIAENGSEGEEASEDGDGGPAENGNAEYAENKEKIEGECEGHDGRES